MPAQSGAVTGKLGIVAGRGSLPGKLLEACRARGRPVFVVALEGEADGAVIGDVPHAHVRIGAAGKLIRLLRQQRCEDVVLAGPITRPSLSTLRPDRRGVRILGRLVAARGGDDSLLAVVIEELEGEGFRVIGADEVLAELLAPAGRWGVHQPDAAALSDIERGVAVIQGLGALDIGQAVIVQQGRILGVEAAEGTDILIARCADLRLDEGPAGVLVKMSKPGQQRRADMPTIGLRTVEGAANTGLAGIAVEADGALAHDRDEAVALADRLGLFLYGLTTT